MERNQIQSNWNHLSHAWKGILKTLYCIIQSYHMTHISADLTQKLKHPF